MFIFLFFCNLTNVVASQPTILKVDAPKEIDLNESTSFNVSVVVENVADFYGWELILTWTAGVVNCTKEIINYEIWGDNCTLGPWVTAPIDNINGKYWQGLTAKPPGTPQNGTFWLVNLTFQIVALPPSSTNFTIQKPEGYHTYCLLDMYGEEIPHLYQNQYVAIVPEFNDFYLLVVSLLFATITVVAIKNTIMEADLIAC
jgi:hypothetical protein